MLFNDERWLYESIWGSNLIEETLVKYNDIDPYIFVDRLPIKFELGIKQNRIYLFSKASGGGYKKFYNLETYEIDNSIALLLFKLWKMEDAIEKTYSYIDIRI